MNQYTRQNDAGKIVGLLLGAWFCLIFIKGTWDGSGFGGGLLQELLPFAILVPVGVFLFPRVIGFFMGSIVIATPVAFIIALLRQGLVFSLEVALLGLCAAFVGFLIARFRPQAIRWYDMKQRNDTIGDFSSDTDIYLAFVENFEKAKERRLDDYRKIDETWGHLDNASDRIHRTNEAVQAVNAFISRIISTEIRVDAEHNFSINDPARMAIYVAEMAQHDGQRGQQYAKELAMAWAKERQRNDSPELMAELTMRGQFVAHIVSDSLGWTYPGIEISVKHSADIFLADVACMTFIPIADLYGLSESTMLAAALAISLLLGWESSPERESI